MDQGFVDLRQNQGDTSSGEHFWPSFTDIMTVIVMIFMLASVVLVIRNWELLENLRQSMEAERAVSEDLRFKSEENATLEEQLAQAQYQLSMLRMQLMQAQETAAQQGKLMQALRAEKRQLQENLGTANERLHIQEGQLKRANEALASLQQQYQEQGQELKGLKDSISDLEAQNLRQSQRINSLLEADSSSQQQILVMKDEYDILKKKYDKLVKPARSPKGRHVVEVRYKKQGGKYLIQFRDSDGTLQPVTRKQLDARLSRLKSAHPGQLYIKIIIPADSGLSYAEAWKFMKSTLEKYDYYYQE